MHVRREGLFENMLREERPLPCGTWQQYEYADHPLFPNMSDPDPDDPDEILVQQGKA